MLAPKGISNVLRSVPWAFRSSGKTRLVERDVPGRATAGNALEENQRLGPKRFADCGRGVDEPTSDGRSRANAV